MPIESIVDIIYYVVLPVVTALVGFIVRNVMTRLDNIENELHKKTSEDTVRQILSDNMDPLKEDLKEIKESQRKLYEFLIKNK